MMMMLMRMVRMTLIMTNDADDASNDAGDGDAHDDDGDVADSTHTPRINLPLLGRARLAWVFPLGRGALD